jgi:hypothetical protein
VAAQVVPEDKVELEVRGEVAAPAAEMAAMVV